ncbi:HGxxPAAW family protein [Kitasatospora purpeofusca]|uniref:HGxxPAAW family protein n=1 Tax=Kitasatospora purpeofusca TaxID=67352 RepID=UPI00364AE0BD
MGAHADHDMGHTVAGWTGTAVVTLGFAVAGAAFVAGSGPGLWAGAALVLLGAVAAWALHLAGRGKATGPRPPGLRHWRTPDPAGRHGHPDCLGCRLAGRRTARAAVPAVVRAAVPAPGSDPVGAAASAPGAGTRI